MRVGRICFNYLCWFQSICALYRRWNNGFCHKIINFHICFNPSVPYTGVGMFDNGGPTKFGITRFNPSVPYTGVGIKYIDLRLMLLHLVSIHLCLIQALEFLQFEYIYKEWFWFQSICALYRRWNFERLYHTVGRTAYVSIHLCLIQALEFVFERL